MSSSSSTTSWSSTLPELAGITTAAMDPARVEEAMRDGYARGHAAGQADGYAAGFAVGEEAGLAALEHDRRRMASALVALGDQLGHLAAAEGAVRAAFDAAAVDAALAIARAVLDHELAVAADPGRDAILRAFAVTATEAATATVRLNPCDIARLGDVDGIVAGLALVIVADPAVEPGGCLLALGETTVDAGIAAALERVRGVLS